MHTHIHFCKNLGIKIISEDEESNTHEQNTHTNTHTHPLSHTQCEVTNMYQQIQMMNAGRKKTFPFVHTYINMHAHVFN
jgi:hypothetical protein